MGRRRDAGWGRQYTGAGAACTCMSSVPVGPVSIHPVCSRLGASAMSWAWVPCYLLADREDSAFPSVFLPISSPSAPSARSAAGLGCWLL